MSYHTQPPTKEQIAAAQHRFFVKRTDEFNTETELKPQRELKQKEVAAVAANKAAVVKYLPDMAPFFNELHEAGMIDGWRGVVKVDVHSKSPLAPLLQSGEIMEVDHGIA